MLSKSGHEVIYLLLVVCCQHLDKRSLILAPYHQNLDRKSFICSVMLTTTGPYLSKVKHWKGSWTGFPTCLWWSIGRCLELVSLPVYGELLEGVSNWVPCTRRQWAVGYHRRPSRWCWWILLQHTYPAFQARPGLQDLQEDLNNKKIA